MAFDYSVDFLALAQIFMSLFTFTQGIIVLIQNPRSNLNRFFFLFQACVLVWMLFMGLGYLTVDPDLALAFAKIGFIGVCSIPISTYLFSAYFGGVQPEKSLVFLGVSSTLLVIMSINSPFFVTGIFHFSWGNYIQIGPGSSIVLLLFGVFIFFFGKNLYISYVKSERRKKWYIFALICGLLSFGGIIDFIPAYGVSLPFHPPGFLFVGIFSSFMSYFILRYNLTDMKLVLGQVAGHGIFIGLLILIYLSFFVTFSPEHGLNDTIINLTFLISSIYLAILLNKIGKKFIDEIFNKEQINFEKKISVFEKKLYRFEDPANFFKEVFDFIEDTLRIENPFFLLIDKKEKSWLIVRPVSAKIDSKKFPMLYKGQPSNLVNEPIDTDQISHIDLVSMEAIEIARKFDGSLLLPLSSRTGVVGFLVLGQQMSQEDNYFQSYDLKKRQALKNLAEAVSISWENVRLLENIESENQLRMDFVSIASHQLRTPLTRLKWTLETVTSKTEGLDSYTRSLLNELQSSTNDMIDLVEQLLGIAESEKGEIIRTSASDVYPIISDIVEKKKLEALKKDISVTISNENTDARAVLSKNSLRIIFETIIDNAIQYSSNHGKVDISIDNQNQNIIEIKIADNGIGIPKKDEGQIFNKFFRGNEAISLRPDGTGIGLYYAKLLAEKQGGSIWFSSIESGGTLFHITLPKEDKTKI